MLYMRMTSITVSSMILSVLAFLAANHKIGGILDDLFDEPPVIRTINLKDDPPPPPPVKKDIPPPPPVILQPQENVIQTTVPVTDPQPPAPPPAPTQIVGAKWLKLPSAREFDKYYPTRATEREKEGRVVLNCAVNADGTINCAVASETPKDWGFGDAAVQISKFFRMAPQTVNGQPTSGGTINVPIAFKLGG